MSSLTFERGLAVFALAALAATALVLVPGATVGQSDATVEITDVAPEVVQVDETVTVQYTANGSGIGDEDVTLVFEHPRGGEEHTVRVDGRSGTDVTQEVDIEPFELAPGPYDVRLEVDGGPDAEVERAIEVAPVFDPDDASFGATESSADDVVSTYEGVAGDFVTVSVSLDEMDEAYVLVGGDEQADGQQTNGPLDVLHVSGSATFVVNTRLVGTDRPTEEVYIPIDGSVTSYAHSIGPTSDPKEEFADLHFENEAYDQVAGTLSEFRDAAKAGPQARPLQQDSELSMVIAGGDSLVVTEDGQADARFPLDRAQIALTQPRIESVTTYRLPTGNADERSFAPDPADIEELEPGGVDGLLDEAVEAGTVARNDRVLVEVNATGMYGALLDGIDGTDRIGSDADLIEPPAFGALLDRPEGITFEMVHTNADPNTETKEVDLFDAPLDDVSVLLDPTYADDPTGMERFYVLVDTRELEPFDPEPDAGDEYEVRMEYARPAEERYEFATVGRDVLSDPFDPVIQDGSPEFYPYLLPSSPEERRTSTFHVEDRFVEYNRTTTSGEPVVPSSRGATITGVTNLAPGTDLPVDIVIDVEDEPTTVEIENVPITENGTFEVETDLSMVEPGEDATIEFWAYQEKLDERPLEVVDSDEASGTFEISELSADAVVNPNGTFTELTAVVTNTGLVTDNKTVGLSLDGESVGNRTLELHPGESRALNFDEELDGLDPGTYTLELQTPDDIDGLALVVEEAAGVFEVTDIDAASTVTDGEPGVDFEATVQNTGTINETATVELLRDGEVVAERTADLLAEQDVVYAFEDELTGLEPGNYTLTVRTPDDEQRVNVTVEEPEAVFELSDVDVASTVAQGEAISPTAVVNNTGTIAGTATVNVTFDGETVGESTVDLSVDANESVAFDETVVDSDPGTYTLRVETADDAETVEVVVEEADDGESGESGEGGDGGESESGENDGSDGGGAPIGLFGVGVGRGAIIGGTALVGAVHVLGYWL